MTTPLVSSAAAVQLAHEQLLTALRRSRPALVTEAARQLAEAAAQLEEAAYLADLALGEPTGLVA